MTDTQFCVPGAVNRYRAGRHYEQRRKASTRNASKRLLARGLLSREACQICGELKVQMHHFDYDNPWHIEWLCPTHHAAADKERRLNEKLP